MQADQAPKQTGSASVSSASGRNLIAQTLTEIPPAPQYQSQVYVKPGSVSKNTSNVIYDSAAPTTTYQPPREVAKPVDLELQQQQALLEQREREFREQLEKERREREEREKELREQLERERKEREQREQEQRERERLEREQREKEQREREQREREQREREFRLV